MAPPPPQKATIIGVQPLLEYLHGKTADQFTSLPMPESSSPWKDLEVYGEGDLYREEIQDQFNDRVIHEGINERRWKGVVVPGLLTTLRKFPRREWLATSDISALTVMIINSFVAEWDILRETTYGYVFGNVCVEPAVTTARKLQSVVTAGVTSNVRAMILGARRPIGKSKQPNHWLFLLYCPGKETLYIIDSLSHITDARTYEPIAKVFHNSWAFATQGKKRLGQHRRTVILPMIQQTDAWSCGYLCAINLMFMFREPKALMDIINGNGMQRDGIVAMYNHFLMVIKAARLYLHVQPAPRQARSTPSKAIQEITDSDDVVEVPTPKAGNKPERQHGPPARPELSALHRERLRHRELIVGSGPEVDKLIKGIHSIHNAALDSKPFTSVCAAQHRVSISADTPTTDNGRSEDLHIVGRPKPSGLRDHDWLEGKWGARYLDAMIRYANEEWAESEDIYTLMRMITHGHPSVYVDKEYGSFFIHQAFSSGMVQAIKRKVRWILLGGYRSYEPSDDNENHFYLIILDTATLQAYFFDPADHTEGEHIEHMKTELSNAVRLIKVAWSTQISNEVPPIEKFYIMRGYEQVDLWSCGFNCALHIFCLFRFPAQTLEDLGNAVEHKSPGTRARRLVLALEQWTGIRIGAKYSQVEKMLLAGSMMFVNQNRSPEKSLLKSARPATPPPKKSNWYIAIPAKPKGAIDQLVQSMSESSLDDQEEPQTAQSQRTRYAMSPFSPTTPTPRVPSRSVQRGAMLPLRNPVPSFTRASTYGDILDLTRDALPEVGQRRLEYYMQYQGGQPFGVTWEGDDYEEAAYRPIPRFPRGWTGWDNYEAQMHAVDEARSGPRPDQGERRRQLSQRLSRRAEVIDLTSDTRSRRGVPRPAGQKK